MFDTSPRFYYNARIITTSMLVSGVLFLIVSAWNPVQRTALSYSIGFVIGGLLTFGFLEWKIRVNAPRWEIECEPENEEVN